MPRQIHWWAEKNTSLETNFDTDAGRLDDHRSKNRSLFPIDSVETFVREAIQNSKDQALDPARPVKVRLRVRRLSSSEDVKFEDCVDLALPRRHYDACVALATRVGSNPLMGEFGKRMSDASDRLLYIEDFRTRGLTGPVTFDLDHEPTVGSANFAMLLLSKGATESGSASRGGSWGYGKSVYWAASQLKCCIFYSQFRDPSGRFRQRIAGRSRLVMHQCGQDKYTGIVLAGESATSGGDYAPIEGADLRAVAKEMGFTPRDPTNESDCGTSVCVVNPLFRPRGGEEEPVAPEIDDLARATAMYYWPSICACGGHPPVLEVEVESRPGQWRTVQPSDYEFLRPFIEGAALPKDEGAWHSRDIINFAVRPLVAEGAKREEGRLFIAVREWDGDCGPFGDESKIAMIRGARMVVGYYDIPFRRDKQMMGVVLAGMALSSHPNSEVQRDLEQWLKRSESAAHDSWSDESRNLPKFRGAKAQILAVDSIIKDSLKSIFHGDATVDGTGAPALAQLLQWPGSGSAPGLRPAPQASRRALTIDYPAEHAGWRQDGEFEVVVRIGWSRAVNAATAQRIEVAFCAVIVDDRDVQMPVSGATVTDLQFFDDADTLVSGSVVEAPTDASRRFALPFGVHARARVRVKGSSRFQDLGVQLQVATEAGVIQ
jgi:RNA polymerase primary sigma factor